MKEPPTWHRGMMTWILPGILVFIWGLAATAAYSQWDARDYYGEEPVNELMRGPVHEAFASPNVYESVPGIIVRTAPPQVITELPSDVAPLGAQVEWISGYWAWDFDVSDYIWISGIWRDIPPGYQWIPGYWYGVAEGYQWVSGFWYYDDEDELDYLPTPPASLERGPATPAPGDGHFWNPGYWDFVELSRSYSWRPGYWMAVQANWIWRPAQYVWTPYGCVFVRGYWDYLLPNRGILYGPLYFRDRNYIRGYQHTPQIVINVTNLSVYNFISPSYRHYYYGDYFQDHYVQRGIVPWQHYRWNRVNYDFTFSYLSHQTSGFSGRVDGWYHYYRSNAGYRPGISQRHQRERLDSMRRANVDVTVIGVTEIGLSHDRYRGARGQDRFVSVSSADRQRFQNSGRRHEQMAQNRRRHEGVRAPAGVTPPRLRVDYDRSNRHGIVGGRVVPGNELPRGRPGRPGGGISRPTDPTPTPGRPGRPGGGISRPTDPTPTPGRPGRPGGGISRPTDPTPTPGRPGRPGGGISRPTDPTPTPGRPGGGGGGSRPGRGGRGGN